MSGVIPGLLWYATAFVVVAGLGLVWDVWRHKDRFEIAARSPLLLCLAGAAHVALVFLQMMAQIFGSSFPCAIVIWASYISFGVILTAYLLRAARLAVVYDKELRRKYKPLVKPSVQRKCMLGALTPCCLAALVIQLRFASERKMAGCCYFFQEGFSIFLPVTVLYLGALAAMASHFKGINDAFKIKNEISHICAATAITSALRTVHISLLKYSEWWSDSDQAYPPTMHDLIACSVTLYISFYRPLRVFYGVGRAFRGVHAARRIFSGSDGDGVSPAEGQAGRAAGEGANETSKPETWGVLQILRDETLSVLLVNFCEQNLCGESVDFLLDIANDYESLADPAQQLEALSKLVDTYLAQGSANEVNVSNASRNEAAAWLGKREEFFALDAAKRTHLLDRQRDEIAKMLGENLLIKFKETPLAIGAFRALNELAAADNATEDEAQDADMKTMLQASAAAEVARIQRLSRATDKALGVSFFVQSRALTGIRDVEEGDDIDDEYDDSMASYTFD